MLKIPVPVPNISHQIKDFYSELYESLDYESDDENELCLISGLPLDKETCVTLECKHTFNYITLYKEICNQKYKMKSYEFGNLTNKERIFIRKYNTFHFIRCPYCRNIQFSILPYYEQLGLPKKYGINSLDENLPDKPTEFIGNNTFVPKTYHTDTNYQYTLYGKIFKHGECSLTGCLNKYVTLLPYTKLNYCQSHFKYGATKQKMQQVKDKQDLLDKLNKERIEKGLKPLKRLPSSSKKQNIVQQGPPITTYEPEPETTVVSGCKALLKTGANKGKPCGCKKIDTNGFCKRHQCKVNETT